MNNREKVRVARQLLDEVREDVLAHVGSPPFPNLDGLMLIRDDLVGWDEEYDSYNYDNRQEMFSGLEEHNQAKRVAKE